MSDPPPLLSSFLTNADGSPNIEGRAVLARFVDLSDESEQLRKALDAVTSIVDRIGGQEASERLSTSEGLARSRGRQEAFGMTAWVSAVCAGLTTAPVVIAKVVLGGPPTTSLHQLADELPVAESAAAAGAFGAVSLGSLLGYWAAARQFGLGTAFNHALHNSEEQAKVLRQTAYATYTAFVEYSGVRDKDHFDALVEQVESNLPLVNAAIETPGITR